MSTPQDPPTDQKVFETQKSHVGRRPGSPPDQRAVETQRISVGWGHQTIHFPDLVRELVEETERLIRDGHMDGLTGMAPAEVDRFVQRLHAEWLAELDPPTCLGGAP